MHLLRMVRSSRTSAISTHEDSLICPILAMSGVFNIRLGARHQGFARQARISGCCELRHAGV